MPFDEPEQTELIDVSAVDRPLPEEVSGTETQVAQPIAEESHAFRAAIDRTSPHITPVAPGMRIATGGERFVAWWIDMAFLWLAYWGGVALYHKILHGQWNGPAPILGVRGALFNGIFLLLAFLYYILSEGILFATIGKLACRMSVRRKDGSHAGYTSIIVRNLLRPLDTVPLGFIALLCMESTARRQRLGDLVAGTVVVKHQSSVDRLPSPVETEMLAGTLGRLLSGTFDLIILVLFIGGWSLLFSSSATVRSQWLLLSYPFAVMGFIAIGQVVTQTSPGKWLLGYAIAQESGARVDLSHAVLRTLFLPFDLSGLGLLSIILSPRWQRIGDAIAGTVVCRRARHWIGALGLLLSIACAGGVAYCGWTNPSSWLRQTEFPWNALLPRVDALPDWPPAPSTPVALAVMNFRFAAGSPDIKRTPAIYLPGETAYFLFEIHGYKKVDREVWIQQDLVVRYPDLSFGLRQENIIDYKQVVQGKGAIELINNVNLPITAMPGKYTVFITVRDQFVGKQVVLQQEFQVKGDLPPPQPQAETKEIQQSITDSQPAAPAPQAPAVAPTIDNYAHPEPVEGPKVMPAPPPPSAPTTAPSVTGPTVLPGPVAPLPVPTPAPTLPAPTAPNIPVAPTPIPVPSIPAPSLPPPSAPTPLVPGPTTPPTLPMPTPPSATPSSVPSVPTPAPATPPTPGAAAVAPSAPSTPPTVPTPTTATPLTETAATPPTAAPAPAGPAVMPGPTPPESVAPDVTAPTEQPTPSVEKKTKSRKRRK